MAKNTSAVETKKFAIGERITFADFTTKFVDTRFGTAEMVIFADDDGNVIRKSFAGGLGAFLDKNKETKTVMLKKVLKDGEFTQNLWSV